MADQYTMARNEQEYERVRLQAVLWEPATRRLFELAGVGPGDHALDVGCGPGEGMRLLASIVGPAGSVTGLDADPALESQVMRSVSGCPTKFIHADAHDIEDVPGAPFDVVYIRLVLLHVADPIALLTRLGRWVRPGGVLIAQDYDMAPMDLLPLTDAWVRAREIIIAVFDAAGRSPRYGTRLARDFASAGLGKPDGIDVAGLIVPGPASTGMCAAVLAGVLDTATGLGVVTERDGRELLTEVSHDNDDPAHDVVFPNLVGVWKRV